MIPLVEHTIVIDAPPSKVWQALTAPQLMKRWMGTPEMAIDVATDWAVGSPIVIRGIHHVRFENKGTVLRYEPNEVLRYSHLSSLSRLPDTPESHSIVELELVPMDQRTSLTVTLSGFPTEVIFKHLDLYWRGTVGILKRFIESR